MGKIFATGGGEIGRPGTLIETESIDRQILDATGKEEPKLLFLPTASGDSEGYSEVVRGYFGERLGARVSVVKLSEERDLEWVRNKIMSSDIVYVGGGNTYNLIKVFKRTGLDSVLREGLNQGVVLAGVSAGAVCWFRRALSDYKSFLNPRDKSFNALTCLGYIPFNITISPHQIVESQRLFELMKYIDDKGGTGLALDDCCCLEVSDGKYRFLSSKEGAGAYKVYKKRGFVKCVKLNPDEEYQDLEVLMQRK